MLENDCWKNEKAEKYAELPVSSFFFLGMLKWRLDDTLWPQA